MNQAQEQTKGAQAKPNLEGVDRALDYLKSYITQQQAGFECMSREYNEIRDAYRDVSEKNAALHKTNAALTTDNAKLTREYNEIRDAYMDVSEKNAKQAKQVAALRTAVRELAGKDPTPTGTAEAAQEVPQPKDNPEKPFEERRGCDCGCGMHVSVLSDDEVPEEVKKIIRMIDSIWNKS